MRNALSTAPRNAVLQVDPSQTTTIKALEAMVTAQAKQIARLSEQVQSLSDQKASGLQQGAAAADTTPEKAAPVRESPRRIAARHLRNIFD